MNRKIYLLLTVLLAWSFNLKAQTAQIDPQTANPGSPVSFDIDVSGLPTDVGAVSLFIGYDPNVLTFTGSAGGDPDFAGYFINNMVGTSQVGIQWTNPAGADINGTLLTLNFQYSALGGTCNLTFDAGCEFTQIDLTPVVVSYTNGSIGPIPGTAIIKIDTLLATAGSVSFGVTGELFTQDAGAVTLYIEFDPDVLQFTGFSSTLTAVMVSGNNTSGLISMVYSNTTGESLNDTFLTLNFIYDGTGSSELVFIDGCEVAYVDLSLPIVSYNKGLIDPLSTQYQMTIADVLNAAPGNVVGIPIEADGYYDNLNNPIDIGAITLYVGFNPAHLEFVGLTNGTITGALANVVSPGLLAIMWSDPAGADINGTLLTMNFEYNFGNSPITFEGSCEVTDINFILFPTTYNDGSISQVTGGPEVSLPTVTGTLGQTVNFPITANNFSMDVGAVSLFIGYDDVVLTYTGSTAGTLTGYFINNMPATSQIGIQWSDINGITFGVNDVLLTLHFTYNGGESDLTFDAGCDFAQPDLTFIPVSYFDGGVISGTFFAIKAFLEGPFNGTNMNAWLYGLNLLPTAHPYGGAPWSYPGTENVVTIPNANVVDWILLEVRESAGAASTATSDSIVATKAAFILNDGSIVDLDGSSNVLVPTVFTNNVYVVVHHRNHIRVMSANALTQVGGVYIYDFTDDLAKAYSAPGFYPPQKNLGGGIYAMYASDMDADGEVFAGDLNILLNDYPTFGAYLSSDADLDGETFSGDLNFLLLNYPTFTAIP